jgi:prolyl oligopeptidase PreP (S9A serine peptidase family)
MKTSRTPTRTTSTCRGWSTKQGNCDQASAVFLAGTCAEALTGYLLDQHVRLVAKAFSAGGLAVGAAINRRPDLFRGVYFQTLF